MTAMPIEDVQHLVQAILAPRYRAVTGRLADWDDLLQIGTLAALQAMPRHDPARGALSTFLHPRVIGAVKDYLRRQDSTGLGRGNYARITSLDAPAHNDHEDSTLGDTLPDPQQEEAFERAEARAQLPNLTRMLRALPARERDVLFRRYWLDEKARTTAQDWGVHETRVAQIHTRALNHLRQLAA